MDKPLFNSSLGLKLSPEQIIQAISEFISVDPRREYKIMVGTDSEVGANGQADFVTAIVIHRVGNGGRYFWRHTILKDIHTLRDRMWREVLLSLDISKLLVNLLKDAGLSRYGFEVHVDVGENGATRTMIQELVGAVRAHNFEAKTKPESYAASKVADRHT